MKEQIDPNILIDIAVELIPDTPPKTKAGKVFRWVEKILRVGRIFVKRGN